jgi:putative ABC transport system permease protein
MNVILKMAFRNIFRQKKRTVITFTAISIGLALLIVSMSLLDGVDKQSISNLINSQSSHIKIFKKGYFANKDEYPLDITLTQAKSIQGKLMEVPGIEGAERRILFAAGLIKGMDELPCHGVAIEPEIDPLILNIKESLVAGQWISDDEPGVIVGQDLAADIDLKIGETITLRMIASAEQDQFNWNAMDFEIKGMVDTGNPAVDSHQVFVSLTQASRAFSLQEDEVTEIIIKLSSDSTTLLNTAKASIAEHLDIQANQLEIYTWIDLADVFLAVSQMKTKNSIMIIMIILGIASLGIINTMLMSVLERTREIGMFSAMGMRKVEIVGLFVLEGGIIGAFGSLLACLLGGLVSWYLEVHGWSLAGWGDTFNRVTASFYPVKDVFYADLTPEVLLMVFGFGTLISMAASGYPAVKAARLNAVDALRSI